MQSLELTLPIGELRLDSGKSLPAVEQRTTTCDKPNVALTAERSDDELVQDLVATGTPPLVDGEDGVALAWCLRPESVLFYACTPPSEAIALELQELEREMPHEIGPLPPAERDSAREGFSDGRVRPVASISVSNGFTFVSVRPPDQEQDRWIVTRAECLARLAFDGISVEMLQFQPQRLRFIVSETVVTQAVASLRGAAVFWRAVPRCSKLCIVGGGIRTTPGAFYRTLTGLAQL